MKKCIMCNFMTESKVFLFQQVEKALKMMLQSSTHQQAEADLVSLH